MIVLMAFLLWKSMMSTIDMWLSNQKSKMGSNEKKAVNYSFFSDSMAFMFAKWLLSQVMNFLILGISMDCAS